MALDILFFHWWATTANATHAEEIGHLNKISFFSYTRFAPKGVGEGIIGYQ